MLTGLAAEVGIEPPEVVVGDANEYVHFRRITLIPENACEGTTVMHLFLHYAFDLARLGDLGPAEEEALIDLLLAEQTPAE